jgi:hypothetical protein
MRKKAAMADSTALRSRRFRAHKRGGDLVAKIAIPRAVINGLMYRGYLSDRKEPESAEVVAAVTTYLIATVPRT